MQDTTTWEAALDRAERLAAEALTITRKAPRGSYAELSRRLDDAEAVLELVARADGYATLARVAEDPDDAVERAEIAEALAREAVHEAERRSRDAA